MSDLGKNQNKSDMPKRKAGVLTKKVSGIPFTAYKGNKPYMFICYAHVDSHIVYPIISEFAGRGYHIWYDEGIEPGIEWPEEIANALSRCALFVVFISPAAVSSLNVRNEINFALMNKQPFVAIHIKDTMLSPGLQLQMGTKQAIFKYKMDAESFRRKYISLFDAVFPPDTKNLEFALSGQDLSKNFDSLDSDLYENIPFSEWSRYRMTVPKVITQAQEEGIQVRQIEVNKMSQMKCPFCGTMQPVRRGVSCANKSCEAFLSARTLKTKQDPLGRFVTTFALEKKPGRPLMSKLNKKTKIFIALFTICIIIGLYLCVIFMLPNAEKIARCESSTIGWNNVFSSVADQYEFSAPYKDGEEIMLVMDVSFLTSANVKLRGYGTASLRDSFDTSVQVSYYFDSTKVTSGETQSITLSIPINDFGVQKPKAIYVRLPIFLDGEDAFILLTYDMVW